MTTATADSTSTPTILTLGDREYEVLLLQPGESWIGGDQMVRRAIELNANLGKEDGQYVLAHQSEVPTELQGKICLVFPAWRHPDYSRDVASSYWNDERCVRRWNNLGRHLYNSNDRLLRRRVPSN